MRALLKGLEEQAATVHGRKGVNHGEGLICWIYSFPDKDLGALSVGDGRIITHVITEGKKESFSEKILQDFIRLPTSLPPDVPSPDSPMSCGVAPELL